MGSNFRFLTSFEDFKTSSARLSTVVDTVDLSLDIDLEIEVWQHLYASLRSNTVARIRRIAHGKREIIIGCLDLFGA